MTECHSNPKLVVQRWYDTDFHACRTINVCNNDKWMWIRSHAFKICEELGRLRTDPEIYTRVSSHVFTSIFEKRWRCLPCPRCDGIWMVRKKRHSSTYFISARQKQEAEGQHRIYFLRVSTTILWSNYKRILIHLFWGARIFQKPRSHLQVLEWEVWHKARSIRRYHQN